MRLGVFGGARGAVPPRCRRPSLLQPEGGAAIASVVLQRLPRTAKVTRALQCHGSWPGGAKHQDEVREVELGLQVQLHRLSLRALRRLPPGVGVAEGRVAHGGGQVGERRQACVALAALGGAAGGGGALAGGGVRVGAKELRAVVATHGLRQDAAAQRQVPHAGVAGPVLAAGGHTCTEHLQRRTCGDGGTVRELEGGRSCGSR